MIYFVRAGQSNWVKIGFAKDPALRLAAIQCGNHEICTIEATIEGSIADERRLHALCRNSARQGEWFELTGVTQKVFALAKAKVSAPEIFAAAERQLKAERLVKEERTARGRVALFKRLAADAATPAFPARWLRMFGIPHAERQASGERKRLIRELQALEDE